MQGPKREDFCLGKWEASLPSRATKIRAILGLLFINRTSLADLRPRDRRELRSHVMQRYVHQRREKQEKEEAIVENREGAQGGLQLAPKVNKVLGAGRVNPFDSMPVTMSSSMSRLLDYCKYSATSITS